MKKLLLILAVALTTLFAKAPDWSVNPAEYEFNAAAFIQVDGMTPDTLLSDMIGFFDKNGKCSGVSKMLYFPVTGQYLHLTMIHMNTTGIYDVLIYSATSDTVLRVGRMKVLSDQIIGTPLEPHVLSIAGREINRDSSKKKIPKINK